VPKLGAAAAASLGKAYFHRTRPYSIDPTLPNCAKTTAGKPATSYPSGHAILGYSTGFVLARLLKGRSSEIFDRAADYAMSRELCGVHFASDLDASHALGTLVASALLANPAFRAKFEAAHAELLAAHVAGA
jgi:acid phosphatase (class A)